MDLYVAVIIYHDGVNDDYEQLLGIFSTMSRAKEAGRLFGLRFNNEAPIWESQFSEGPGLEDFQFARLGKHEIVISLHGLDTPEIVLPDLADMDYSDYLQTNHWKEVRAAALKRAGYRCMICNRKDVKLHTHHRTYERRGAELPEDVIVLCENCHGLFHKHMKINK